MGTKSTKAPMTEARVRELNLKRFRGLTKDEAGELLAEIDRLGACAKALRRLGCQDEGSCDAGAPDGLCFVCAALAKAEAA